MRHAQRNVLEIALTDEQLWPRLLAWQTRREHSQYELQQKLAALGVESAQIQSLISKLQSYGLQSDQRCADILWRSAIAQGRGLMAIRQRFQQKGLSLELLPEEQRVEVDWLEAAKAVLRKRFGDEPPADPKEQARRIRFLQYRGFNLSQAMSAIRQ